MKSVCLLLTVIFVVTGPVYALDLREELAASTFEKSGLSKLSAEELATLNAAVSEIIGERESEKRVALKDEVRAEVEAELQIPQGEDRFGFESVKNRVRELFQNEGPDVIESRITGEFRGWSGKTKFNLDNGQVWQQTQPDTFYVNVNNPKVRIRRGMFGSYLLNIDGFNSSVKVERVQ